MRCVSAVLLLALSALAGCAMKPAKANTTNAERVAQQAFVGPLSLGRVYAHRGSSAEAPENTLPAFQLAAQSGADGIETDIRRTRDGQWVLIHDADTQRVAGESWRVAQTDLAALQSLDVGNYRGPGHTLANIPTLTAVLQQLPSHMSALLEIKAADGDLAGLLRTLQQQDIAPSRLILMSFDDQVLKQLHEMNCPYPRMWLAAFAPNQQGKSPSAENLMQHMRAIGAQGLSLDQAHLRQDHLAFFREKNIPVLVWTVDDPIRASQLLRWGADGVITNTPAQMRAHLMANHLY